MIGISQLCFKNAEINRLPLSTSHILLRSMAAGNMCMEKFYYVVCMCGVCVICECFIFSFL